MLIRLGRTKRFFAGAFVLLLSACAGGGGAPPAGVAPQTSLPAVSGSANVLFTVTVPTAATSSSRRPAYISAATASASIAVNGGTPTVIACTSVCTATVVAPIASDTFAVQLFDASSNLLSTGSITQTIVKSSANTIDVTMNPVVASISLSVGAAAAGTAASIPITVTAKDAAGNTIIGPGSYVDSAGNPLTIALEDTDVSGASSLSLASVTAPGATVTLTYSGLAILPVALTATAGSLVPASVAFAPALQPIVVATGDTANPSFVGIDLYSATGTGSTESLNASEAGWTNAPFNQTLSLTVDPGCSTIATFAAAPAFTATAVALPTPGTCMATLSDALGQSLAVTLAYSNFSYTGADQSFTLPAGVTTLVSTVAGAAGGAQIGDGGSGAVVVATVSDVSAGAGLLVVAGQAGSWGEGTASYGGGGAGSGSGGGGSAIFAAGVPLVVAGGGGGGVYLPNGPGTGQPTEVVTGGGGGAAGTPNGGDGTVLMPMGQGPGAGATQAAGGVGGQGSFGSGASGTELSAGVLGMGGTGAAGGGGGYFGGGGGADGGSYDYDGSLEVFTGGAGGGGSSFAPANATYAATNTGNGYVVVQF